MKQAILFLLIMNTSIVSYAQSIRLSEPVASDATSETFGTTLDSSLKTVTITELATNSEHHLGKNFQVETRIAKVCQKKGCFFIAQQNEHVIRVSFKDYGFFIPTDSSGKTVLLSGELIQKEMSEKQAAHYTSDLQAQPGEVKAGVVYEIVATSVKVPIG